MFNALLSFAFIVELSIKTLFSPPGDAVCVKRYLFNFKFYINGNLQIYFLKIDNA